MIAGAVVAVVVLLGAVVVVLDTGSSPPGHGSGPASVLSSAEERPSTTAVPTSDTAVPPATIAPAPTTVPAPPQSTPIPPPPQAPPAAPSGVSSAQLDAIRAVAAFNALRAGAGPPPTVAPTAPTTQVTSPAATPGEAQFLAQIGASLAPVEVQQHALTLARSTCQALSDLDRRAKGVPGGQDAAVGAIRSIVDQLATSAAEQLGDVAAARRLISAAVTAAARSMCPEFLPLVSTALPASAT